MFGSYTSGGGTAQAWEQVVSERGILSECIQLPWSQGRDPLPSMAWSYRHARGHLGTNDGGGSAGCGRT